MRKKLYETPIGRVNAAARSCGLSYGQYVSLTGGAETPPDWLVQRTRPDARHCARCGRAFLPTSPRQIYCTPYCRKAAYDERVQARPQGDPSRPE